MKQEPLPEQFFRTCKRWPLLRELEDIPTRQREIEICRKDMSGLVQRLLDSEKSTEDAETWFALGHAASTGWGMDRNLEKAVIWFRQAANAGHIQAMVRLANLLERSEDKSIQAEAVSWYRRATEKGSISGMISMGFSYREGSGVDASAESAASWFEKAALAGDSNAWIYAGRVHIRQLNQPDEALKCFLHAMQAGNYESHLELACLYAERHSPLYNPKEALPWYEKVANRKCGSQPRAMIALAKFYHNGEGTPQDTVMARLWLLRACEITPKNSNWHREATALLKAMQEEML